jgi:hypothetical protein
MDMRIVVGILAAGLLAGIYFFEDSITGEPRLSAEDLRGPEARSWLKTSENESALASNRFLETPNALRFVEQLYAAGAVKVIVPKSSIRDDGVEVYADALVVTLPDDPAKRQQVWKLCAAEIKREGFDPGKPDASGHVFLWWD